ncbi:MAG: transposase [Clostridia bacterium]|nr:transposase [Clostridia bacterium]
MDADLHNKYSSGIYLYMQQISGRKICLKPSKAQIPVLRRMCAVARRAYNWKLAQQNKAYELAKQNTPPGHKIKCEFGTPIDWHKEWCIYKKLPENKWMAEVSKFCGQEALRDLGAAWKRFFKGQAKHPRFHRYDVNESFRCSGNVFIGRDFVQIPTIGKIRLQEKNYVKIPVGVDRIPLSMATVSVDATGKWFVSFIYKTDIIPIYETVSSITADDIVGIDFGIKDLAITSEGMVYANPKGYARAKQRLRRYQRALARKRKHSKNRIKCKHKIARLYQRITNARINVAHQFTSDVVYKSKPKMVVIEDLKPSNMTKNHKLASAILDANFGRMRNYLEYKCKWNNIQLIQAPCFYASSQYCSHCGQYKKEDLKLKDREWVCPVCGHRHDRDFNAAENLKFYGLWLTELVSTRNTCGENTVEACLPCERSEEGVAYVDPKDKRLQFFETQEQCLLLKQEITLMHYIDNRSI